MAVAAQSKNYFDYKAGIITEASPLNFPEGASLDEQNFIIRRDGTRERRRPLNIEVGVPRAAQEVGEVGGPQHDWGQSYYWTNAGGSGEDYYVYVNIDTIKLMRAYPATGARSPDKVLPLSVLSGLPSIASVDNEVSITALSGVLYIAGASLNLNVVTWVATDEFEISFLVPVERDLQGVEDGLQLTDRPPTLETHHWYNLINQGWLQKDVDAPKVALYNAFYTASGDTEYPSNADNPTHGWFTHASAGTRTWDKSQLDSYTGTTGAAPKGHTLREVLDTREAPLFIDDNQQVAVSGTFSEIDAGAGTGTQLRLSIDMGAPVGTVGVGTLVIIDNWRYERVSSLGTNFGYIKGKFLVDVADTINGVYEVIVDVPSYNLADSVFSTDIVGRLGESSLTGGRIEPEAQGFAVCASFNGRLFMAHNHSTRLQERVYFSKIVAIPEDANKFYQEADPTSDAISDLVDTDGGYIRIAGMGTVLELVPYLESVIVIATNGVWEIGPGEKGFFSPVSYTVRQVTLEGGVGRHSSAVTPQGLFYWSASGINVLTEHQVTGKLVAQSVSLTTVQTLFTAISSTALSHVRGVFDIAENRLLWFYPEEGQGPLPGHRPKVLALDLTLGAFYRWQFNPTVGPNFFQVLYPLYQIQEADASKRLRVLVIDEDANELHLAYFADTSGGATPYSDFGFNEQPTYLITGHEIAEDARKPRTTRYVHVYMEQLDDSSCFVRGRWDFRTSGDSGKFSSSQQAYRPRATSALSIAKLALRGSGRALNLRFDAEENKRCNLQGWTVGYVAGQSE